MQTLAAQCLFLLWMFTLQVSVECKPHDVNPKFDNRREFRRGAETITRSDYDDGEFPTRDSTVYALPIVGGEQSRIGVNRWQAAIIKSNDPRQRPFCGGSLISERHVLTAAHCLFKTEKCLSFCFWIREREVQLEPRELIVKLGAFDWTKNEKSARKFYVERITPHEGYALGAGDDIALLTLEDKVTFGKYIDEIALPPKGAVYTGEEARVTGWGLVKKGGLQPHQLRTVDVEIYDDLLIDGRWISFEGSDKYIYAGREHGGEDICRGDSGGPLSVEGDEPDIRVLVGVAARTSCGNETAPLGIYMRVTYYLPWIRQNMAAEDLP